MQWWNDIHLMDEFCYRITGRRGFVNIESAIAFMLKRKYPDSIPFKKALSNGCGNGQKEYRLLVDGIYESIDMFDIDAKRIVICRKRFTDIVKKSINIVHGDAFKLTADNYVVLMRLSIPKGRRLRNVIYHVEERIAKMPMSRDDTYNAVMQQVKKYKPRLILDVGCGDGFYGLAFRRALDGDVSAGRGVHKRQSWITQIEAVEIYKPYITPVHRYVYNTIYISDVFGMLNLIKNNYDLIFLGDVIEHMNLEMGTLLLKELQTRLARGGRLIVVTPNYRTQFEKSPNENPFEQHLSLWTKKDFESITGYKGIAVSVIGKKLMAILQA